MGNPNLTFAETQARAKLVTVESYRVELTLSDPLDDSAATFLSRTSITFNADRPGSTTWLDLIADSVDSVHLNGEVVDPPGYDGARLPLPGLAATNHVEVVARCRYMRTGEGLHRFVDPVDGQAYVYTQLATADARRVFACFEQPDLKGSFTWVVHAPDGWSVVSNSPVAQRLPAGPGSLTWHFEPTPPLPTYVTSLVGGPFERVTETYAGVAAQIPLGVLCRRSMLEHLDAAEILGVTKAGLAFYESAFELPYPFAKYDQIFVPEFNLGAMENPGAVTFAEDSFVFRSRVTAAARQFRAEVILHEMAHMWFGDLVTMRWWDDLWLNESFAEWAGHHVASVATAFTESWATFALGRKAWAVEQDQLPTTHPISAQMVDLESVYLNFDGITYAKGASVLRQLVAWVGQDAFLSGLRTYFNHHAWGNTTLSDLLVELSRASGRELQEWSDRWLRTTGVNTVGVAVDRQRDGTYRSVVLTQAPAASPPGVVGALRPHRLVLGGYRWADVPDPTDAGSASDGRTPAARRLRRAWRKEVDLLGARLELPELAGTAAMDLLLPNDEDLAYAKVRLDPGSLATALAHVSAMDPALARAVTWGSIWDCVRDGELPAPRFVGAVVANLGVEPNVGLVQAVLRQLPEAVFRYTPESVSVDGQPPAAVPVRERLTLALGRATRQWLLDAQPGSDHQLAWIRAMAQWAYSDHELDLLRELLAGSSLCPGLQVDRDLRWAILRRLVAAGAADSSEIVAELAADDTLSGRQAAALAQASIPTESAKRAAWSSLVDRDDLPNAVVRATVTGFACVEQAALLDGYVERYFHVIGSLWDQRSTGTAATLARGLFPAWSVEPATLERCRVLLAREDLPTGLRRIVAEGADGLARALRCQDACESAARTDPDALGP